MDEDKLKKIGMGLLISHLLEACIASRVARRKGKSGVLYFFLTLIFGVFVLVPLIRSEAKEKEEKEEEESEEEEEEAD